MIVYFIFKKTLDMDSILMKCILHGFSDTPKKNFFITKYIFNSPQIINCLEKLNRIIEIDVFI